MNEKNSYKKPDLYLSIGMSIDYLFGHNEIIGLWYPDKTGGYRRFYRCEAWATPDEYRKLRIIRFIGVVAEEISESDTINIVVEVNEDTVLGLPKKKHDNHNCTEGSHENVKISQ